MRRLFLNRSEPAKKSGQNIPKNRCRTTIAERMMETLAELPFIGDQVVCLSQGSKRNSAVTASAQRESQLIPRTAAHWKRPLPWQTMPQLVRRSFMTVGAMK
jgi:hypothetical protein